jgi:uncharacterized protein
MTTNQAQPTQPHERVELIDILRGFALFGILLVNMMHFAWPIYREAIDITLWTGPWDRAAEVLIAFLAEGKFFTLFSLLFGLGLAIQLERAEAKGVAFVPLYVRRLVILLAIGLAHAFLFWWGDILTYYALLGFLLLLFRHKTPRALLAWAGALVLVPIVINTLLVGAVILGRTTPEGTAQLEATLAQTEATYRAAFEQALAVYGGSDFLAMIPQRIGDWGFATVGVLYGGMLFVVLAMFLFGLYFGKRRLLHDAASHLRLWRKVFGWGVAIGLVGNALYVVLARAGGALEPSWGTLVGLVGFLVGAPALSLAYASSLVLLVQRPSWLKRLRPLAPVGRMALSNYLLQTLLATTLVHGYGLGLYGRIGPAAGIALTLAIFAVQIPLSAWWLARFRFGPLEWLWRNLTYGRLQPLRYDSRPPPR